MTQRAYDPCGQPGDGRRPMERVRATLEHHGLEPKPSGSRWSARCPVHDDRSPSLSIAEGEDGRVLLKCHANHGCTTEAIVAALGLRMDDLFPVGTQPQRRTKAAPRHRTERRRAPNAKPRARSFPTAEAAIAAYVAQLGRTSAQHSYHDAAGEFVGVVLRWDGRNGKQIRPVARVEDGRWIQGGMAEPRPLYRLPELLALKAEGKLPRVWVVEGEKCADALLALGLLATTSAHGSKAAGQTDWSPLAGFKIATSPDHDEPGESYAQDVARLMAQAGAASVAFLELPGLGPGEDVADWISARRADAWDDARIRRELQRLADVAEPLDLATLRAEAAADGLAKAADSLAWQPFPVEVLPDPVRGFVSAGAKAIGCDPSYVGLPILTVIAAAIGNSRRLELKRGWTALAILWAAIVGESGTAKTPAFKLVMRPIRERQRKALQRHAEAMRQYEAEFARFEKAMTEWKRDKKTTDDPPAKPVMPQAERCVVSDTTVEALAPLLLANPRGLLLARDELAGWIGSFDRYAGGKKGTDEANWLSMHNGESMTVDRKTGNRRTIEVPLATVSVCGGIQPGILHQALGIKHRESGLASRLLLTCPPRKVKRWTEADIDPAAEAEIARLLDRLYGLQPTETDEGEPQPVVVSLTPEAKEAWRAYYNDHAQEQADLTGELSAAWSKLEEYAARLALVVHFARWAADDPTLASADVVDASSMAAGIALATWFKHEACRVYAILSESDEERDCRRLAEWIGSRGGAVTARDVQMGCRWLRAPGAAEAALKALVAAGWGAWQTVGATHQGGRPTRAFRLARCVNVNGTPSKSEERDGFVDEALSTCSLNGTEACIEGHPRLEEIDLTPRVNGTLSNADESEGFDDVDTVDTPELHAGDEWGEV